MTIALSVYVLLIITVNSTQFIDITTIFLHYCFTIIYWHLLKKLCKFPPETLWEKFVNCLFCFFFDQQISAWNSMYSSHATQSTVHLQRTLGKRERILYWSFCEHALTEQYFQNCLWPSAKPYQTGRRSHWTSSTCQQSRIGSGWPYPYVGPGGQLRSEHWGSDHPERCGTPRTPVPNERRWAVA